MMRIAWMLMMIVPAALAQPQEWQREMLAAHNAARARVKVPALAWSGKLAAYAQQWANTLLNDKQLKHRRETPYGENLFVVAGERSSPRAVVRVWASEPVKDYNHHTQIVWSRTTEVGCAVARNAKREVWVCNYNPPGNVVGERPY